MENILERAHNALTGDAVLRLSSQIHESPTATERGLECAVPVSITGLAMVAASEPAAGELLRALRGGDYPHVAPEELSSSVSDPSATNRLAESGEGLLSRIFGNKLDAIVDALAGQAGVSRASAIKLLGLSAPIVLDYVGKEAQSGRLDANGLSRYLADESRAASGVLPGPVSTALADARQGVPVQRPGEPRAERQEWRPGERRAMGEQVRARTGAARNRIEGAAADVRERAGHLGADIREKAGDVRERVGDMRDDMRHRARGTDYDTEHRHVSAEPVVHERRPGRGVMWLLAAIVLIGVVALLMARARRRETDMPLPRGDMRGLEAPRTAPLTAPDLPAPREAVPPAGVQEESQTAPPEGTLGAEQAAREPGAPELEVLTASSGAAPLNSFLDSNAPPPKRFVLEMIEFDTGASNVDANPALDAVADSLKDHPGRKIRIDGYADAEGANAPNKALSKERAAQVKKYLVDRGVPTERIETAGQGESHQRDTKAQNRRVELVVLTH